MEPQPETRKKVALEEVNGLQDEEKTFGHEASPLMSLPKEIWALIFNRVPQKCRILHRFVNKEWCRNVDEFSTVDVNFNADFPLERHRERVLQLKIRSCKFSSLHIPFSPDFKNPLLIKEITFTTHVSASNVLRILSACTKVESLRFLTTMLSETSFQENDSVTPVLNNLKSLQYLEIGILTFLDRSASPKSKTFSAIIGNDAVLLPALKSLNVAFLVRHVEWLQLFKFISRHSITLKSLNVICPCGERGCEQRGKELLLPRNLVFPQLETLVVNGASECSCRNDVWVLLDRQRNLRRYETDFSRGALLLKDIVENNHETIRLLKLEIGSFYDELNCDIFSKCIHLQELSLRLDGGFVMIVVNVSGGTTQSRVPALFNLEALPKDLKRLTLCGSQISSSELQNMFSQERKLEELTLGRAESLKVKSTGLTLKILITMLENMVNLKKFRVFLDMLCELESKEVYYCSDLKGIWLRVWDIAKGMNILEDDCTDDPQAKCCGDRYNVEACLNHRPYIDMIFKTETTRIEFLSHLKEFEQEISSKRCS